MSTALVQIRKASRSDAAQISRVHDEAWRSTYQGIIPHLHLEKMISRRGPRWWIRQLSRERSETLVLVFNDTVQGYASFGTARMPRRNRTGEIYELYLAPTYQGLGLGRKLFEAARDALAANGAKSLLVWALADNQGACDFYARLGGQWCATTPERYGGVSLDRVAFLWETVGRHAR